MRLCVCLERLFISVLRLMNMMVLLVESVMACDEKLIAWHEFYKLSLSI